MIQRPDQTGAQGPLAATRFGAKLVRRISRMRPFRRSPSTISYVLMLKCYRCPGLLQVMLVLPRTDDDRSPSGRLTEAVHGVTRFENRQAVDVHGVEPNLAERLREVTPATPYRVINDYERPRVRRGSPWNEDGVGNRGPLRPPLERVTATKDAQDEQNSCYSPHSLTCVA